MNESVLNFVAEVLKNKAIQDATNGRVYSFITEQGEHSYPLIFWEVITSKPLAEDLTSVGETWQSEVQISVFTQSPTSTAKLSKIVQNAFNNATLTSGIYSSQANQIVPAFQSDDDVVMCAVRVFINYRL